MPRTELGVPCDLCDEEAVVALQEPRIAARYYCSAHEPAELPDGCTRFAAEQLPAGVGRLLFRVEDVARLLGRGRDICWVKDVGTYLGVWDEGALVDAAPAYTLTGLCLDDKVACVDDGARFDAIWEATRDICGGDDFCETGIEIPGVPAGAQWLVFDVTPETVSLGWA